MHFEVLHPTCIYYFCDFCEKVRVGLHFSTRIYDSCSVVDRSISPSFDKPFCFFDSLSCSLRCVLLSVAVITAFCLNSYSFNKSSYQNGRVPTFSISSSEVVWLFGDLFHINSETSGQVPRSTLPEFWLKLHRIYSSI